MKWNKRIFLSWALLLMALGIMVACQSQDAAIPKIDSPTESEADGSSQPASEPTDTPDSNVIETLSAAIGAEGGALTSADGTIELHFPPDALSETTEVAIVLREAVPADGAGLSPILEISLTPALAAPLTIPAMLLFHDRGTEGVRYGRLTTMPGNIDAPEGDAPAAIVYWQPLEYTRINEEGGLQLWMADFSTYAILDDLPSNCGDVSLTPPPEAAAAYAYVGRKIIVNQTFTTTWANLTTTVPPGRMRLPDDELVVQRQEVAGCGWVMAVDIYTPITSVDAPFPQEICNQPFDPWQVPDAPPGHQYYSTKIFVDGILSETIMADAPPALPETGAPTITLTNSGQSGGEQACSSTIVHTYVSLPPVLSDSLDPRCIPDQEFLTASYAPSGYDYVGHDVFVNGNYISDLSTIPLDRAPLPGDMVNPASRTTTSNGTLICDTAVSHLFEQPGDKDSPLIPISFSQTSPPGPIDGYTYQGYAVIVNGEPYPEMGTLPPMPDGADDIHLARAYYNGMQGNDPITSTVNHLYKPQNQGTCVIPPEWLIPPPTPPCHRYVGRTPVVNLTVIEELMTTPRNREPKMTDVRIIKSNTLVKDKATKCDIVVVHTFEPIECAPPEIIIPSESPPHVHDYDCEEGGYMSVYFPPDANLSEADRAFLMSISIRTPVEGEDGSLRIALPSGTQVTSEDGQTIIQVPQND